MIDRFVEYLRVEGKSENTVKSYKLHISNYLNWFDGTYSVTFKSLYRENVLDYKAYLLNVKKFKEKNLSAKTVNAKLSALQKFNRFMVEKGFQTNNVISKNDLIRIQVSYANPADIDKNQIESFRQRILESKDKRLYALVTLLSYAGLRISEALAVRMSDFNLETREMVVRKGKGEKQRIVYLSTKIGNAIREYLKFSPGKTEYLFPSREGNRLNRTVINKKFKNYLLNITPHTLRHFYCSNAIEAGYSIHEVANQAGHQNIQTTMIYTNPTRSEMKRKAELL